MSSLDWSYFVDSINNAIRYSRTISSGLPPGVSCR
jgi:hypothetical protein